MCCFTIWKLNIPGLICTIVFTFFATSIQVKTKLELRVDILIHWDSTHWMSAPRRKSALEKPDGETDVCDAGSERALLMGNVGNVLSSTHRPAPALTKVSLSLLSPREAGCQDRDRRKRRCSGNQTEQTRGSYYTLQHTLCTPPPTCCPWQGWCCRVSLPMGALQDIQERKEGTTLKRHWHHFLGALSKEKQSHPCVPLDCSNKANMVEKYKLKKKLGSFELGKEGRVCLTWSQYPTRSN